MRIWICCIGGFSFVITSEDLPIPDWHGYTASWKNARYEAEQAPNRIEGQFATMAEAETACQKTYKQLRQKN